MIILISVNWKDFMISNTYDYMSFASGEISLQRMLVVRNK